MRTDHGSRAAVTLTCLASLFTLAPAHPDELVAPYVPTVEEDVELMLDVGGVGATDYLIDLGSGDGRIVIAAARRGAHAQGVELDPSLVTLARANAVEARVTDRAAFVEGNIFETDISAASVVTLYLFPEANLALRPKLLAELRPGSRVLSNSFTMGDWEPDAHDLSARSSGGILLWIVPARVQGSWTLVVDGPGPEGELELTQRYQRIAVTGFAEAGPQADAARWRPRHAELRGDRLSFSVADGDRVLAFSGRADGDTMQGIVHIHDASGTAVAHWRASRRPAAGG